MESAETARRRARNPTPRSRASREQRRVPPGDSRQRPRPAAAAIAPALTDALVNPDQVDYINGTRPARRSATPARRSIKLALGDRAATVPVSSTKARPATSCAAAAVEAMACIAVRATNRPADDQPRRTRPDCAGLCHSERGPAAAGHRGRGPTCSASAAATPRWCWCALTRIFFPNRWMF